MAIPTSNIKLIAAATAAAAVLAAGSSSLYAYLLHRRLSRSIQHIHKACHGKDLATATEQKDEDKKDETQPICTTLPDQVLISDQYLVVYDRAWRILDRENDLPSDQELTAILGGNSAASWTLDQKLLTVYLRRNMSAFARYLPQSRFIRLMIRKTNPELLHTFDPEGIKKLNFELGDVVCGIYRVVRREVAVVEFGMIQPTPNYHTQTREKENEEGAGQGFEGRLVIGMRPMEGGSLEVYSETIMWRDINDSKVVMPLERTVPRILHELASWWLLDSGVMYLKGLRR